MRQDVSYQQDQLARSGHRTPPGTVTGTGDSEMEQHSAFICSECVQAPADVASRMSCTIAPLEQLRARVDLAVALGSCRLPAGLGAVSNIRWGREVAGASRFPCWATGRVTKENGRSKHVLRARQCVLHPFMHPPSQWEHGCAASALQWCHLCPLTTEAMRSNLLSLLLQGLMLVAAWLSWAKAYEQRDRTRYWLPF